MNPEDPPIIDAATDTAAASTAATAGTTAERAAMPGIRLYRSRRSGHCHRVELLLRLLGLPFEMIDVDLARGEHRTPEFLARNPLGQVPVIEDGADVVSDSNAIMVYLVTRHAPDSRWLSQDPRTAAQIQRWLSVAAGELVQGPMLARLAALRGEPLDPRRQAAGAALFHLIDAHLRDRRFLAADHPTLADLAIYSYTARAPEGGIDLTPFPAIRQWLARIEALEGFVPLVPL